MNELVFKFLLVQYCGFGNRLQNLTNGIFTIFNNLIQEKLDKGYYLASIVNNTKDKNGNDMYIVELKSNLPEMYIPIGTQNYNCDNTAFYVALEIITHKEVSINVYWFRLLYAICQERFAVGNFQVKKMKKIYDLAVSGDFNNYVLEQLRKTLKEVQFLVTRNAALYFPQLVEAVGTPQPVDKVNFKLNDINSDLKKYIRDTSIKYISIPAIYSNMEQDTLSFEYILKNIEYCINLRPTIIYYKNYAVFKCYEKSQKCG